MSLISNQDLPLKEQPKKEWTMRKIFSFEKIAAAFKGFYNNIEEILCTYLIIVVGLGELFGRTASWRIYALILCLLLILLADRYFPKPSDRWHHTKTTLPENLPSSSPESKAN